MDRTIRKTESGLAVILTFASVGLHIRATGAAGALWRDEANTVTLATLPTLTRVWQNIEFDSFPLVWLMVVRVYASIVGPMNDQAFRTLGLFVGLALTCALWFNARTFRYRLPLVSLALLGLSPSMIIWGDSMRAYGLGITLILFTNAFIWRLVEIPSPSNFALAGIAAVLSVNTIFYNAVLLLAFCAAGAMVCVRRGHSSRAALIISIGALAALSLIGYRSQISHAAEWNMLVRMQDYTFAWFWYRLSDTLLAGGRWAVIIWTQVFVLSLVLGLLAVRRSRQFGLSPAQGDAAVYGIAALSVGAPASFLFLNKLSYYTAPWYYLTLIVLVAVCSDIILGTIARRTSLRLSRIFAVILIAAITLPAAFDSVRTRLTNIDTISSELHARADEGDIIIVSPWHNGVSFDRYYRGPAPWITIPPLSSPTLHRYDLVKIQMLEADQETPVKPALARMRDALMTGHDVFFVGTPVFSLPGQSPVVLPPAPEGRPGWNTSAYDRQWTTMLTHFLREHAVTIRRISVAGDTRVSRHENLTLLVASGWRAPPFSPSPAAAPLVPD